jgi:anti-anti-sigma factor
VLSGELDCASAPQLRRALEQLIIEGHRDLRINVSALAFLDAAGIGALTDVRVRLAELHGRLSLLGVGGIPHRALTACGMLEIFAPADAVTRRMPTAADRTTS